MIEAYKIATNMTITGDAQKKMMEFFNIVQKTSVEMEKFIKLLKLTDVTFNTFGKEARMGTMAIRQFDASLISAGRDAVRARGQIDGLKNSMKSLNAAGGSRGFGGFGAGMIGGLASRYIAPAAVAYGAYSLGKASFQSDIEFEKKIGQLTARGYTPSQIKDVRGWVARNNISGVSSTGMIDAYVDALMATQDPSQAKFLAPSLAKGASYAAATYGGITGSQQQDLVRFAEYRSGGDAAKTKAGIELGFQIMALSGGSIKPNQLRALTKYGGGAVSRLSDSALSGLEPIIQMMGGSSLGTGLQTGSLQLIGGQMSTAKGKSLSNLGMFDRGGINYDASGRTLGSKFGKFRFANDLQTDPFRFLMRDYLPALAKKGITDPGQIDQRIQYDFSRKFAQALILMNDNQAKILRTMVAAKQIQKGDPMYAAFLKTSLGAQTTLGKSWQTFETALGKFEEPTVTAGLTIASKILDGLSYALTKLSDAGLNRTPLSELINGDHSITGIAKSLAQTIPAVKLYMSGKQLAQIVWANLPNQMTDLGTTQIIPAYHGISPSANTVGGGMSV